MIADATSTGEAPRPSPADLYLAALTAHEAGFCPVAVRDDGSKRPVGDGWARWQRERPPSDLLRRWFLVKGWPGFGLLFGPVSGGAECLEWDEAGAFPAYCQRAAEWGLTELVERVAAGYLEASPGGGVHAIYRTRVIEGNTKLAQRPKRPDEMRDPHDRWKTTMETRGRGGFAIVAPSGSGTHPTGRPYVLLRGGFASVVTISGEEREDLFALARSFDLRPKAGYSPAPSTAASSIGGRPGDDYDARGDVLGLLGRHGWVIVAARGDELYLRRPGKDRGVSATFGYRGSRYFYPFTSSTDFDPDRGYRPFRVFAVLEHDGDYRAATRALARDGYGARRRPVLVVPATLGRRPVVDLTEEVRRAR